jgi:two-component system KDP operon response regulator KdpE
MADIMLIDDDEALCQLLSEYLTNLGHTVRVAHDGRQGLRDAFASPPDLIVLDVTMPRQDGWETLHRIRDLTDLPVIMLTARDDEPDVLRGFSLGADDYITKPFSFAELAARIQAVLSRVAEETNAVGQSLSVGDLKIDLATNRVTRSGKIIKLTPTEFNLLAALMRRVGHVVSPDELVREVWGPEYADEVEHVRRYIWHLRRKVEPDPEHPRYIHNERGFGYRVHVDPGDSQSESMNVSGR